MSNDNSINRRKALKFMLVGASGFAGSAAAMPPGIGAMIPGKGWVKASGEQCPNDGTPLQFLPKTAPDPKPLEDELKKYPRCPYCGMSRKKFNHSRHLVQYDDNLVDGTCSIHCLAISLSLNIDRGPKAIYAADFGSSEPIKPMVEVDKATYLIGSRLKGTMTMTSKVAFASADTAKAAQKENGGKLGDFDSALTAAYADMATSTVMIRKRRAEKRKMMMRKMQGK